MEGGRGGRGGSCVGGAVDAGALLETNRGEAGGKVSDVEGEAWANGEDDGKAGIDAGDDGDGSDDDVSDDEVDDDKALEFALGVNCGSIRGPKRASWCG